MDPAELLGACMELGVLVRLLLPQIELDDTLRPHFSASLGGSKFVATGMGSNEAPSSEARFVPTLLFSAPGSPGWLADTIEFPATEFHIELECLGNGNACVASMFT